MDAIKLNIGDIDKALLCLLSFFSSHRKKSWNSEFMHMELYIQKSKE